VTSKNERYVFDVLAFLKSNKLLPETLTCPHCRLLSFKFGRRRHTTSLSVWRKTTFNGKEISYCL